MYFDFEDQRPDITPVGRAISWREGILMSIIFHMGVGIFLLLSPLLFPEDPNLQAVQELAQAKSPEDDTRFVFVRPRVDMPAPRPPERAQPSDQDRVARAAERAAEPLNQLPASRGNSPDTVEQVEQAELPAEPANDQVNDPVNESASGETLAALDPPEAPEGLGAAPRPSPRIGEGALGDALRNLQRYVEKEQFNNPRGGGGAFGPAIQFDTMGVEFGPWIRRFVAQVKRNWEPLIPLAAWSMQGHVVITFNVHKNGLITDLAVVKPASIQAFNTAAFGALTSSSPTAPLPMEYPAPKAFFTVTFFYNEAPP
jgi:TonB family protein